MCISTFEDDEGIGSLYLILIYMHGTYSLKPFFLSLSLYSYRGFVITYRKEKESTLPLTVVVVVVFIRNWALWNAGRRMKHSFHLYAYRMEIYFIFFFLRGGRKKKMK
jgi:hypothetical protein